MPRACYWALGLVFAIFGRGSVKLPHFPFVPDIPACRIVVLGCVVILQIRIAVDHIEKTDGNLDGSLQLLPLV